MKKSTYLLMLALLLCSLCGCGAKADDTGTNAEASGNFSSEMLIQDTSDVTIVEMP